MTAPAPSPDSPQAAAPVERTGPSRRAIIGWTAAMFTVLAVAWFVGAVVWPVWQVRSGLEDVGWFSSGPVDRIPGGDELVAKLGGPAAAASKLALYLRLPEFIAPDKECAVVVLGDIGPDAREAVPTLRALSARAKDKDLRYAASHALRRITARRTSTCDGKYAVLPWDTFPEFGKTKPVRFVEMALKDGSGEIEIRYKDGTSYSIGVEVKIADEGLLFHYTFPVGALSCDQDEVSLRRAEGFLEIRYIKEWVRFAKRLQEGERMPYPGWDKITPRAWGSTASGEDK